MAQKTKVASKGEAKSRRSKPTEVVGAAMSSEPERLASASDSGNLEPLPAASLPEDSEQAVIAGIPGDSEQLTGEDAAGVPEPVVGDGIARVRQAWEGHVCCGLATRGYQRSADGSGNSGKKQEQSGVPIGMYCENHGAKYWITGRGVALP